jgi:glycine C-acetyltransferase
MERKFDVIIVGARVAGCAAAIEFAKCGQKVLLLDQAPFPSDTLSTHFMNPRGMTYLGSLGVADEILKSTPAFEYLDVAIDDFDLGGRVELSALRTRLKKLHGERKFVMESRYACIRRTLLDDTLQQAARKLGVEIMTRFRVDDILLENGKAVGVAGQSNGQSAQFHARLVVGADGRKSAVARILGLEKHEEKQACTFACYTYFSGLHLPHGKLRRRDRTAYAAVPTNDGNTMVLVYGPSAFYKSFKEAKEKNFFKAIEKIDPEFFSELKNSGVRVENFYSTDDQSAFMRKTSSHRVPLLGDASLFKDQCTASGMMYALRDGLLLADHLAPALEGRTSIDESLRNFEEARYIDSQRYYDFTASQAEMNPVRGDERELYEAIAREPQERNQFVSVYFDVAEVREFFSQRNTHRLQATLATTPRPSRSDNFEEIYRNPFSSCDNEFSPEFERSCLDFAQPHGRRFEDRVQGYLDFYRLRQNKCAYQYSRTLHSFPGARTELSDESGRRIKGINFASQDYLGLGQDPELREAALEALDRFGPHSAGSPMIIGNTLLTRELEAELSALTGKKHVLIFPTGYAAGMGSILGLVRQHDHIVMDRLSHACLQQGAYAATRKIQRFAHLDPAAARAVLKSIRARDHRNGILLITEGLFSMDADSPDLKAFQEVASEFDATLFVDVAHDLGATGPGGTGQIGRQGMLGKIDLVMGSFSKTFATNGGFLATNSEAILQYVKMYSTPHLFSNALSPIQTAVALRSARIIRSPKGERLRQQLSDVVNLLRQEFARHGMICMGEPSPIVPVVIGSEREARICHRLSTQHNIANMILEYPVVALGATRFRLQVMASHTREDAVTAASIISKIIQEARGEQRPEESPQLAAV